MFTPNHVAITARSLLMLGALGVAVLMLGPFQGAERYFGLNDFEAHAAAFYVLCAMCFLAGPRMRRNDIALIILGLGAAAEVAQTVTGRSASFGDIGADAVGVFAAWAPTQIERLRQLAREHPHRRFSELGRSDRRRPTGMGVTELTAVRLRIPNPSAHS
jgi:hypothetical protein